MFKKRAQKLAAEIESLEKALATWRLLSDFFAEDLGPIKMKEGENIRDTIARCLGITRAAFDETHRLLRSINAGRVISRSEL